MFSTGRLSGFTALLVLMPMNSYATSSDSSRGLVEDTNGKNVLLAVGVSHGLPGIDIDVNNVIKMGNDSAYKFTASSLMEESGDTATVAAKTTELAKLVDNTGTFFFYYSGHGSVGSIYLQDKSMPIADLRKAIQTAREGKSPLARLVLMFDSCHSGSLMDPMRVWPRLSPGEEDAANEMVAESIVNEFTDSNRELPYWRKLFVFASSRADETSLAGENGSVFTVALKKAFDEAVGANRTIGEFVEKTKKYTEGHHPVERLVPSSLKDEKMHP